MKILKILGGVVAGGFVLLLLMYAGGIYLAQQDAAAKKKTPAVVKAENLVKMCIEGKQAVGVLNIVGFNPIIMWDQDQQGRPILCGGEPLDLRQKGQE